MNEYFFKYSYLSISSMQPLFIIPQNLFGYIFSKYKLYVQHPIKIESFFNYLLMFSTISYIYDKV